MSSHLAINFEYYNTFFGLDIAVSASLAHLIIHKLCDYLIHSSHDSLKINTLHTISL